MYKYFQFCFFTMVLLGALAVGASAQWPVQKARVEIDKNGYSPASIVLKKGFPAKITFLRKTDDTCATEVVFPDFKIRRELPLNRAVVISLKPTQSGEFAFMCGMDMHRGKLIVQ